MKNYLLLLATLLTLTMCQKNTSSVIPPIDPTPEPKFDFKVDFLDISNAPLPKGFSVQKMLFDANDKLWILTISQGLFSFDTKTNIWQKFDARNAPFKTYKSGTETFTELESMDLGLDNNLYVTNRGLISNEFYKFDGSRWSKDTVGDLITSSIKVNKSNGTVWLTTNSGIYEVRNGQKKLHNDALLKTDKGHFLFYDMDIDAQGRTWVGGDNFVAVYDGNWQRFQTNTAVVNFNLIADKNNKIWTGASNYFHAFEGPNMVFSCQDTLRVRDFSFVWAERNPATNHFFLTSFSSGLMFVEPEKNKFTLLNQKNTDFPKGVKDWQITAFDSKGTVWVGGEGFIGRLPANVR